MKFKQDPIAMLIAAIFAFGLVWALAALAITALWGFAKALLFFFV